MLRLCRTHVCIFPFIGVTRTWLFEPLAMKVGFRMCTLFHLQAVLCTFSSSIELHVSSSTCELVELCRGACQPELFSLKAQFLFHYFCSWKMITSSQYFSHGFLGIMTRESEWVSELIQGWVTLPPVGCRVVQHKACMEPSRNVQNYDCLVERTVRGFSILWAGSMSNSTVYPPKTRAVNCQDWCFSDHHICFHIVGLYILHCPFCFRRPFLIYSIIIYKLYNVI